MTDERPKPLKATHRSPSRLFPIVAIGASAGGLDACTKLVDALAKGLDRTAGSMAFILVQHLDPNHASMMADLLAGHTTMVVAQAQNDSIIQPGHLYIIPPGNYLSVTAGRLHLSKPTAPHGARLPFDFLLQSLAMDCPSRTTGVILSGTGADGTIGLTLLHSAGGFTMAQSPDEAEYQGMPMAAIAAGAIDLILPVTEIAAVLMDSTRRSLNIHLAPNTDSTLFTEIIELLRASANHDFTLYKMGTLQRRIERRMGLALIDNLSTYLERLKTDATELDLLAKDLLINVTSFFRDMAVFDMLAKSIVPDMVRDHPADRPLRIWIAGCSSGEEAYSLAMLFREAIISSKRDIKLQVFASDVDGDAISAARVGIYPETIAPQISAERLARFFVKEDQGYRVSPELRAAVVFTVQDVLADPPFSRLDMVSCRNLLIYLGPEAQAKVIALFHFALREGGILLLGNAETIGSNESRFKVISKVERLYRHVGRSKPGEIGFQIGQAEAARSSNRNSQGQITHQNKLADLVQRLVAEAHCPAAVLINRKNEALFSSGPTERYLRVAPGHPSHDILSMAPQSLRTKLRSAIQQAIQTNALVIVTGRRSEQGSPLADFDIHVTPVNSEGEPLLLVCFVDVPVTKAWKSRAASPTNAARVVELEHELETTRTELQGAIHNLEISGEEQRAVNEEALSVNEEFQSTNEELLTSKEELQSLNEELTALNSQLQETLDRQRITSNDLQNVLYSTDVATLFLDTNLNIRFFTPATTALFNLIPGDVGRPLTDLKSLSADQALSEDAHHVLASLDAIDREIETTPGLWFVRRILPYLADDGKVEGVVITFTDVSERKQIKLALEDAKQQADRANEAKSRFLAAASHDLRQPLQTLALLQGLLAKIVEGPKAQQLVKRVDDTLGAMSGMLNTLLDINQIEAGTVRAEISTFPVGDLLERLRSEFVYHADAKQLSLRLVPCGLSIASDPRLLEQILRNLIANAIKYTSKGKVLIGCRRHSDHLRIEIWDSGVGIDAFDLGAIFEEYHQVDNAARERSQGLGLGLSIVKRLGNLLGYRVHVRSIPAKGSVFAVDVKTLPRQSGKQDSVPKDITLKTQGGGQILIIEDDPELRELLKIMLDDEGHNVVLAYDGAAALKLATDAQFKPGLILSDYNLPGGMNGVEVTARLRQKIGHMVPVIILTGDISTAALRNIADHDCEQLNKPVKPNILIQAIRRMLAATPNKFNENAVVYIVDDDTLIRTSMREMLEAEGHEVKDFANCEEFLSTYQPLQEGCLLIDAYLPGMTGLELLQRLKESGDHLPAIMITGNSDVPIAVEAMKAGAVDFIEKPIGTAELLASITRALELAQNVSKRSDQQIAAAKLVAGLTKRQHQVMDLVLAGQPSKIIAADLGISQRTVENHRAAIMTKTGTTSLPALARLALAAKAK
ncbi:response regulator [Sphingorhabdus sp. IMCC26285]|uniref:histidine kinase n=1 Tax=Sphingorhabdus profundilacus TaxID=2509718 RepID=A0A6I4LRR5_9SPHN|nr:CheR family methyltransferase [Sphingorhabdus profundilacus]MVZ96087.1 response regulator [Sphingorhabdus profundilacus]